MIIRIAVRVPLMMVFSVVMAFAVSPSLAWIRCVYPRARRDHSPDFIEIVPVYDAGI